MEYPIREATINDVDLAVRFRLYSSGGVPESTVRNYVEKVRELYTRKYKDGSIVHYFAYNGEGKPIASVGALLKSDFPYCLFEPTRYGWIIDVYTSPEYRGRKIASTLLKKTHEWLKSKGIYESKLLACGKKPQELYAKLGYRPTWEMSLNLKPDVLTFNEIIDRKDAEYSNSGLK